MDPDPRVAYQPSPAQRQRLEKLFSEDFDPYENVT
jgi:hypothetical protein